MNSTISMHNFDNAQRHQDAEKRYAEIHPIKQLPTCSPMLNPAENALSA